MKILLTNDDGLRAPGMTVLREIAAQLSDDVWVVAPDTEQSAASRGVSLHNPVRVIKAGEKVYSVTGTPTDSVILAMRDVMADAPPDLVLSGVNRGQNIAEDVTFSGTIAGALQGMQMGVPSIALSLAKGLHPAPVNPASPKNAAGQNLFENPLRAGRLQWETALQHAPGLIKKLLAKGWPKDVIINVNFPDCAPDAVKGVQVTRQGHRDFQMTGADRRPHPRGGEYFWLTYGAQKSDPPAGTDLRAIYEDFISVSPLHVDLTHERALADLEAALS